MELSWLLVFLTLCVQVILITILCIPHHYLPAIIRRAIIRVFEEAQNSPNIVLSYKITTGLLLLLFLDAVRTINHLDEKERHEHAGMAELNIKLRLFRNQRNMYMSFFAVFFMIIIYRLQRLFAELHNANEANKAKTDKKKE